MTAHVDCIIIITIKLLFIDGSCSCPHLVTFEYSRSFFFQY